MNRVRAAVLPFSILLVMAGAAGCGQATTSAGVASAAGQAAGASPSSTTSSDQDQRYNQCLSGHGVTMMAGADGTSEVDKERTPIATVVAAAEACRDQAPVQVAAPRLSAQDLEKRRQQAACIRDHGVGDYPDPDPETGEPALTEALAARLKTDTHFSAAMEQCRGADESAVGSAVG